MPIEPNIFGEINNIPEEEFERKFKEYIEKIIEIKTKLVYYNELKDLIRKGTITREQKEDYGKIRNLVYTKPLDPRLSNCKHKFEKYKYISKHCGRERGYKNLINI